MKTNPSHPMPLPGGPSPGDPENPTHLPVDPDDGGVPSPVSPEEEEGGTWQPPS
ncbi:MAG: hypothetical protein V4731_16430 [Pseudomonadota bacterium]